MLLTEKLKKRCHTADNRSEAVFSPLLCFAVTAALFFAFLFCFCLFWAGTHRQPLHSELILSENDESYTPLLFESHGSDVIFVCSGEGSSVIMKLNSATGKLIAQKTLDFPLYWAALRGETLFIRNDSAQNSILSAYDLITLEKTSEQQLNFNQDELAFFDCDYQGSCYCVFSNSRAVLHGLSANGEKTSRDFSLPIEFMETEDNGRLWVYSGQQLFAAQQGQAFNTCDFSAVPYHLLGNSRLIDTDGVVYHLTETVAPLFKCADTIYDRFSFCLDDENCLIVSKNGGEISRSNELGAVTGTCTLEKTALAICSLGGIYRENRGIYYSAFSFSGTGASPSASPLPTITPGPDYPPAHAEGDFIVMPAGTTAGKLRELFKPEAVVIRDKHGNQVYHGRISTGMTAGDWTLVIRGDCNGTGSVNIADKKKAMYFVIYSYHPEIEDNPEDAYHRAADMDDNGIVDLRDLKLLAELVDAEDKN